MNFLKTLTIAIILVGILGLGITGKAYGNDDKICPEGMNLDQCRIHLEKKAAALAKESKVVSSNLSSERYNQLTLNQRIEYTKRKIAESEFEIKRTEIELETKNVEIRMMERDIQETQNNIATVKQESQKLESSITKRLSMSYKYSFMKPIELLLNSQDINILLRSMKYLIEARNNDKILLTEMQNKSVVLDAEEKVLGARKLDLEKKRIEVENKKTDLFKQKENLAAQQSEQTNLLAISKQREATYAETLAQIEKTQNQVTRQITAIIKQMYERGQIPLNRRVYKGERIGFQGHTGFTYGSHIHFEVNFGHTNPFANGYLIGSNHRGSTVQSNRADAPLDNTIVSWPFHGTLSGGAYALDLVSTTMGIQSNDRYYGNEIRCLGWVRQPGWYGLRGEGAPVYAMAEGFASAIQIDACGGKYVVIKHDDGNSSLYLHLQ